MGKNAIIVGSGIAGIAAAIRLNKAGYSVKVYEANTYPGGKLTEIKMDGYRFDAGPSLFTMPEQVEELFQLCGYEPEKYFEYDRLEVNCHYFYEDGLHLKAYADHEKFIDEVTSKTEESEASLRKVLDNSKHLYVMLADLFMYKSLHRWRTFFNKKAFKSYLNIFSLDFFRTMNQANADFLKDARIVQLFNRYATYNGSNPYETPATLNIIPHLEFGKGAFFPKKGMHDITLSLYKLATDIGVQFQFDAPVEKILIEGKKAVGVKVAGVESRAEVVVSNMDIVNTYKKLLADVRQPDLLLNQPKSSSALIFYWGIAHSFDQLDLHNIFFSKDYAHEFDCIFNKKIISSDPTVYVNITSKMKPDDAPQGHENWFTMINVPNNSGQDWDALIAEARENIIKKLNGLLNTDIAALITCEQILDPRTIESKTSSSLGALYGNSSNNKYSAFLRHANFSRKIDGLYFCGGSVHPGGGIPLSLLSAKIMAEQL
jgi:phytoene desaturase